MTGGEYYRQIVAEVRGRGGLFKATQPDGLSFMGSPKKLYIVGETIEADGAGNELCKAGLLHVSDTPSETLAGGSWPARLFEVRGEIIAGFAGDHPHKGGAKKLSVVRELPSWIALGPNGRVVAAFIEALPTLDAAARAAGWVAAWAAADWDAAWAAARAAARAAGWAAARDAACDAAWDAAWDAARALVVADLITPERLAALYAPFEAALPLEELRKRAIAAYPIGKLN